MVFLERSKVNLSCEVVTAVARPGGVVAGTVRLQVKEKVTFSSLRLFITGMETLELMVQQGTRTSAIKHELPYLNRCITVTGPSHDSGDRTKQSYEIGAYSFPFTVAIPVNCPPSFALSTQSGRATMRYTVKAVIEIPNGFDAVSEQSFHVLSVAPESQYRRLSCGGKQEERAAQVYRRAVLCCLCGRKEGCQVRVSAKMAPGVFCVGTPRNAMEPTSQEDNNADPGTAPSVSVTVYLCVDNTMNDEELASVKVELRNVCAIMHDSHQSLLSTSVAVADVAESIAPGEARELVLELPVHIDSLRRKQRESTNVPLPTLSTTAVRSTYFLDITFPHNAVGGGLKFVGLVNVVHEISAARGVRDTPGQFHLLSSWRPTEVRYVATPARVEFPQDVQALFEAEPQHYLPADSRDPNAVREEHLVITASGPDSDKESYFAEDDGGSTASHAFAAHQDHRVNDGRPVPDGTVDAVVVSGNVVRGVMQGIDTRSDDDEL